MGFVHPVHEGLLKTLGVDLDQRGNVRANMSDYQTSLPKVFSAGDMRRGQSLVVWAIREGRLCARAIDTFLMGSDDAAEVKDCRAPERERMTRRISSALVRCRADFVTNAGHGCGPGAAEPREATLHRVRDTSQAIKQPPPAESPRPR